MGYHHWLDGDWAHIGRGEAQPVGIFLDGEPPAMWLRKQIAENATDGPSIGISGEIQHSAP